MFKNIGSNWVLNLIRIVVLLHLTRFVVLELGEGVNGVWVSIVSTTGLLKLLILGVPMASVRYLTEALAKDDNEGANRAFSTCLGMCGALGVAAGVVGVALFFGFERVLLERWSHLGQDVLQHARVAYGVLMIQICLGFAMRLPYALFDAHHHFVPRNLVMLGELILRYGLTLFLLSRNASLVTLASVQVACMLAEFVIMMWWSRKHYPAIRFSLRGFDKTMIRGVLSFSIFAMLLNLGALLAFRIDALVIGANMAPEAVTRYDIGNKFWEPLMEFLIGIGIVVMPMATRLSAQGKLDELRDVFFKWSKIAFSLVLFAALYLVVLGPSFLGWWIEPDYTEHSGPVLQIIMLSAIAFLPARGVALPILMGLNKPKAPALSFAAMAVLNVILSLALVGPMGLRGVALGTAIPNLLFTGILLFLTFRELDVKPAAWLTYVLGRAVFGFLPTLGCLLLLRTYWPPDSLLKFAICGFIALGVFAATWILFVFRNDQHLDLYANLRQRLAQRSGNTA